MLLPGKKKRLTLQTGNTHSGCTNIRQLILFQSTSFRGLFVLIFLSLNSFTIIGSSTTVYDNNATIRQAHQYLYALRPLSAEKLLKQEEIKNPGNGYVIFYRMYSEIITLTISNSPEQYKNKVSKLNEYVSKLEKLPDNAPDYRLLLGEAKVMTGLLNVKFGSKFSGLLECLKGYNLLEDNARKYPQFKPDEKIPGIIKIGVAFMPPVLKFGVKLFGITGNPQAGLKNLSDFAAFAKGKSGYEEESYLYFMAAYKLMNQPEAAMKLVKKEMDGFKEIAVLNYFAATICLEANDAETAILLISRIEQGKIEIDLHPLLYLKGKAKLLRFDSDADIPMITFLKKSAGPDYRKTILYDLACFYYISGNPVKYNEYIQQVKVQGREFLSRDMEAAYEAKKSNPPNRYLLKAEFLVRGGYCNNANIELSKAYKYGLTPNEKVEYYYLKGECNRLGGLVTPAETEYMKAVSFGEASGNYFAQKALSQAGLMMEENGNRSEAEKYYNLCLEFEPITNPYSVLYTNKAKAGLIRLSLLK